MKKVFKVTALDKEKATFKNDTGWNLVWPLEELPPDIKEGDEIILTITKNPETKEEKQLLAKNILNEILNIQE